MDYGLEHMYDVPIVYSIPFVAFWVVLDIVLLKFSQTDSKITQNDKWKKNTARKWIHRINGILSFLITLSLFLLLNEIR